MALRDTIIKIEELSRELETFRPISPEQEKRIMDKFHLDWNYNSNNIEGNTLTYGETKALLLEGVTAQGKPLKDHIEVQGHNEAILWIEEVIKKGRPLTESFIRELHKMILKEPYEVDAVTPDGQPTRRIIHIGQYKTAPNHVLTKTGEIFRFATPEETPAKMDDLIQWFREEQNKEGLSPLLLAAEFHYRFIRIHPFDDGNGRLSRILMNFILMMCGYPPVVIKTEKKEEYYAALRQADAGDLEFFFDYIGQQLIWSMDIMIRGAKGEPIEELDDIDKEIALFKEQLKKEDDVRFTNKPELILGLYRQSFQPMFEKLHDKLEKFDDMFLVKSDGCLVNGATSGMPGDIYNSDINRRFDAVQNVLKRMEKITDPDATRNLELELHELAVNYITYYVNWDGFKKNKDNPFAIAVSIDVHFDKITYSIRSNSDSRGAFADIKKAYHEVVSEQEIDIIVTSMTRKTLESIKARQANS